MAGTTIDFDLDLGGILEDVVEEAETKAREALGGALVQMSGEAKLLAPAGGTAALANSIRPGTVTGSLAGGNLSGAISASAPGAEAQEFGSGLHGPNASKYPIYPRFKKALRFPIAGFIGPIDPKHQAAIKSRSGFEFARKVMHPGVQAQRFLQRGVEAKLPMLEEELAAAIQLAVLGER